MPTNIVWLLHVSILRWDPACPALEEITPKATCFASVRYLVALYHLEKIVPEAKKNGIPTEKILEVMAPSYPDLTLDKIIGDLSHYPFIQACGAGFLLNREKIQEQMFDCHACRQQVILGQDGCQNTACPSNKG
ncbi:MAG: hypothetical protein ABIH38_02175 [Patescibacteria group bacterium]